MARMRLFFRIAVALIAVAIADPLVETIANAGWVGGRYHDDNHLGVVPTMLVGALLVLELLVLRFLDVWRRSANRPLAAVDVAAGLGTRSLARDLPFVIAFQLVALFALENAEELITSGQFVGGTIWLGGPVLFSLTTHALLGTCCTFVLGACLRTLAATLVSFVRTAIRFTWLAFARPSGGAFDIGRRNVQCPRAQTVHVRQRGGRAPPLHTATA